jgi:hypothetical protein
LHSPPNAFHVLCPSHPYLSHSNYIWRKLQVMKLLSVQLFPWRHFINTKPVK